MLHLIQDARDNFIGPIHHKNELETDPNFSIFIISENIRNLYTYYLAGF